MSLLQYGRMLASSIFIIIIIIIIIIILFITFMLGIYNYVPKTNYVPRVHNEASILCLQFTLHVILYTIFNYLYF